MFRAWFACCVVLLVLGPGVRAEAQTAPSSPPPPVESSQIQVPLPTLNLRTTLVQVPVSVRTKSGEPVFTLEASDFVVTDDGVPQAIRLEADTDQRPLALVVVLEAGSAPETKFSDYEGLSQMLDAIAGGGQHQVAVVGFDSEPAVVQPWTASLDEAERSLGAIQTGDGGSASLDALVMAVDLLRKQPVGYRRAILLVSETVDRGSHLPLAVALRAVSDTNTVIYALGYSSGRSASKHEALQAVHSNDAGPPHGCMGREADVDLEGNPLPPPAEPKAQGSHANSKAMQAFDCLSLLVPPLRLAKAAVLAALDGFRTNVPETAARISGGEYFHVENGKKLVKDLFAISNQLPNRYYLSFTPVSMHPGLHAISVTLSPPREGVVVQARTSYWEDAPAR
jgi:VWFA-related protein